MRKCLPAVLAALISALCPSCSKGPGFYDGEARIERDGNPARKKDNDPYDSTEYDFYASLVEAPEDFDWRRNETLGNWKGIIHFLCNGKELFSLQTGETECISAEPYTHHIIDGALFTEYAAYSNTVVKKNGETVVLFEGREILRGLMEKDGSVYTLSQKHSGEGFSLRKDGLPVLVRDSGVIFGGMDDLSYGSAGALYQSNGHYWFCYHTDEGIFVVKDGAEKRFWPISGASVLDLKVCEGTCLSIQRLSGRLVLCDGDFRDDLCPGGPEDINSRIVVHPIYGPGAWVPSSKNSSFFVGSTEVSYFSGYRPFFYAGNRMEAAMDIDRDRVVHLDFGGGTSSIDGGQLVMGPFCAAVCKSEFCVAVVPFRSGSPRIWRSGSGMEAFNVNGYFSAIAYKTVK